MKYSNFAIVALFFAVSFLIIVPFYYTPPTPIYGDLAVNLLGTLLGVYLAFKLSDYTAREEKESRAQEMREQFDRLRLQLTSAMLNNYSHCTDLLVSLKSKKHLVLLPLNLAIWDATKEAFLAQAPTDDLRINFATHFERVGRLARTLEIWSPHMYKSDTRSKQLRDVVEQNLWTDAILTQANVDGVLAKGSSPDLHQTYQRLKEEREEKIRSGLLAASWP